ncbi:MAG: hypothetical protein K0R84_937 [Clostridia bacterium]|nr:hypothetical protein [Clostridia bacterium]
MNIAIQRGLESLVNVLESHGHRVFYIGENQVADAVLYNEMDTYPYYEVNNIPSVTSATAAENIGYGALLLNVSNKSEDEILRILDRRLYSPIF